jgi:uncharacterized protein YecE (DUF72 family)
MSRNSLSTAFSLTSGDTQLAVGPSGWQYPHWEGVIYPKQQRRGFHALEFLASQFDAVEISSSFESEIRPEVARLWIEKVKGNERFQFTARLHKRFTHEQAFDEAEVARHAAGLRELKRAHRLGAVLMQFPWSFRYTRENREYLIALRRAFHEFPLVAEMRHESWMSGEATGTLIDYHVGFCNLDQPEHVRSMPPTAFLTSPVAYFRLHGRERAWWWNEYRQSTIPQEERNRTGRTQGYAYSPAELAAWRERVEQVAPIAERTFVFFTNDGGGQSVINALQFRALWERAANRQLPAGEEGGLRLAVA